MTEIDVRFEADHDVPEMRAGRPMLTWGCHPRHGNGWTLWYLEDPDSPTSGIDSHFIPGDITDVDEAVHSAQKWLKLSAREIN